MIRMWIIPVSGQQNLWLVRAENSHHGSSGLFSEPDVSVRLIEIYSHIEFHYARRFPRLLRANFWCSARPHLAPSHIAYSSAIT